MKISRIPVGVACLMVGIPLLLGAGQNKKGGSMDEAKALQIVVSNGPVIFARYGQYGLIRNVESYRNSIMVNKIKFTNAGNRPVSVESCVIGLRAQGRTYVETHLDPAWIKQEAALGFKEMTNPRRQTLFKSNPFYAGDFVDGPVIAPGKAMVLQNQYFDAYAPKKVDEVEIRCTVAGGGRASERFKVAAYEQKNEFIFPMRGDLAVVGGPDHIWGHRMMLSQEFAFDVMVVRDGRFYRDDPFKPESHFCFGQDVLAPADGTVVDVEDGLADNPVSYDFKEIEKHAAAQPQGMSLVFSSGGNRVTIDHGHAEFSSSCHLQRNSIQVKKGEAVKRGQVIARCGNSGSGSTSPHLHFHFMNGPDLVSAVGLPISFMNLDNSAFSDEALKRMAVPAEFEKLFAGWGAEFALVKTK